MQHSLACVLMLATTLLSCSDTSSTMLLNGNTVLGAMAAPETESTTMLEYPAKVTCGSVIKLMNKTLSMYLRSQEIQYGSGSGLQTVTAFDVAEEAFNYWTVYCVDEMKESNGMW